jgi:hypothetical protein
MLLLPLWWWRSGSLAKTGAWHARPDGAVGTTAGGKRLLFDTTKEHSMNLKHALLIAGFVAATSTGALAQQANTTQGHSGTAGAMRSQQAPSTGVTTPSPGAPSNSGFGSSAAGGSGGTATGPTSPSGGGAISGMGNTHP